MTPWYYYGWLRRWDARPSRLRAVYYACRLWWIGRQWQQPERGA